MYVTALTAQLDPATARVTFANAGHRPLVVCRKGKVGGPLHSDGIALGFDKGPVFDRTIKDTEFVLEPGDRMLLASPAMFDLVGAGDEVPEKSIYTLLGRESAKNSAAFVPLVLNGLAELQDTADPVKNFTFLTVKRLG
jgi:serine phosphatase RsbU (regulator of sigma subunit)